MRFIAVVSPEGKVTSTVKQGPPPGVKGHASGAEHSGREVTIVPVPPPEHTVHEVELPDELGQLSAEDLHAKIEEMLARSRKPPTVRR